MLSPAGNTSSNLYPLLLFPPLYWWAAALHHPEGIRLYTGYPLCNGSYRNRHQVATANAPLLLSVPIQGGRRQGASITETYIDNSQPWQRQHWRTLFSAYGRAPYFEHYGPALEALLHAPHNLLAGLNEAAIAWLAKEMQLSLSFEKTDAVQPQELDGYLRLARFPEVPSLPPYHQVFEARNGFLPNLSAIDLLMNEGPYAGRYIRQPG